MVSGNPIASPLFAGSGLNSSGNPYDVFFNYLRFDEFGDDLHITAVDLFGASAAVQRLLPL